MNPKGAEARHLDKPPLDLLEYVADTEISRALKYGAEKYGVQNYRTIPIEARIYGAAIRRHVGAWLDGEDCADDSGIHHLAHIAAGVHVVLGAIAAGTLVDDRGPRNVGS